MTSLLTLRPSPPPALPYLADALPGAYEEAGKVQFQAMPGMRWIRDTASPNGRGFWRGPREAVELVAATLESAGVCKVQSTFDPIEVLTLGRSFDDLPPGGFDARLRSYQGDGAAWLKYMLRTSGGALLADEMGLGKTPQAIVAFNGRDTDNRLIVCPAVVVPHWESELDKWGDRANGWVVQSYEKFARGIAKWNQVTWSAAIFDEIHYLSNPKSQRSKAAAAWRKAHPSTPVIGLSGTPMTTEPHTLWHPLDILWPGRFGRWWDYTRRYCGGHWEKITDTRGVEIVNSEGEPLKPAWKFDGISHAEELRARLAHCMLRRTKSQVGAELPPRTRTIVEVSLPTKARRDAKHEAAALDFASGRDIDHMLRHAEVYKLDTAEALARDVMASGSRPLLLTTRRDSARQLAEALGCPYVTGEVAADARRSMIADAPVAVATMYSVETGINLTGFDVIIFVGLDWVPSKILQAESRIHRIGQDKPCTIYYLIARGTVDEVIQTRVIERLEGFAAVTGTGGDELGLARELAPETEDELIAAIVAAVKGKAA